MTTFGLLLILTARVDPLHREKARRLLNCRGDRFRCLDALAGDVDNAEQDILAVQKATQVEPDRAATR